MVGLCSGIREACADVLGVEIRVVLEYLCLGGALSQKRQHAYRANLRATDDRATVHDLRVYHSVIQERHFLRLPAEAAFWSRKIYGMQAKPRPNGVTGVLCEHRQHRDRHAGRHPLGQVGADVPLT